MKLSLIVPCYNEEGNILPLYQKVNETFEGKLSDYEFVFVNDGSFDQTAAVLKDLVKTADKPVTVVNFSRNFGKESAIYAGLEQAAGDYTALIDGDLQQNPSFVLDMVNYLDEHPDTDCVCAYQEGRKESPVMVFLKAGFYKVINYLTDVPFVSNASDFRTFRSNIRDTLLSLKENNRFSKGLFAWVGFETYYMPYTVEERLSGTSKWNLIKLFKYAFDGIMDFSVKPLAFSLAAGGAAFLSSLWYLGKNLVCKDGDASNNKVLGTLLLLGSVELISIGILSKYVGSTYMQAKGRPIYIAKSILTNKN